MAVGTRFPTAFVGRQSETADLLDAVREHSLVTLVGPGGIGKTRLALQVLEKAGPWFGERFWLVELADVHDPVLVGHAVSAALDVPAPGEVVDLAALAAAIGPEPGLLLLDNCEHLVDACAALVDELLRRWPGLTVLTTGRQALRLIGEYSYPVPALESDDAVDLFEVRARAAAPQWQLTEPHRDAVDELCRVLEGMPLAIELIATQVRNFPPQVLVERFRDQLAEVGAARGEPRRLTSLDASIRWSHDLCTEAEQLLWHRLAVFAGGFTLDAAEDVCAGDGLDRSDVLGALAGLVEKSVVLRDGDDRYRLLELIRQFGLTALGDTELVGWRRRHRDHYLALAHEFDASWWGPDQASWMVRLQGERRNLTAAFEFSTGSPEDAAQALRMSGFLEHFFAATGGGGEAVRWLQLLLAHGSGDDEARANALRVGCFIANLVGDLESPVAWHTELQAIAARTDDPRIRAYLLYAESQVRTYQGDIDAGIAAATEGVALLHTLGELGLEANLHFLRGMILGWAGRPDEAAAAYQCCFEVADAFGDRWLTSYSQWGLGVDALTSGDVDRAIELERSALRAKAEFGDQLGIALTLEPLAWAAAEQGRGRDAAFLLAAAAAIADRIGMGAGALPSLSERREAAVARTREILSPGELEELTALGRKLPLPAVLAVALGEAGPPHPTAGRSLTRREREIAELVAAGASNRAIAEQLVISVRTVETHVEHVLRKLGVGARTAVAGVMDQAGGS